MADRREVVAVYGAGLVQGVALVAFPAASSILTSPDYYGLSSTAYGALFLPQAIAAISGALAGSRLTRTRGVKRMLVFGLIGDLAAMSLLVLSQFFIDQATLAYAMLLLATTSLGIGFGLAVPALNTLAAAFAPAAADRAVLQLNALLGLGTALAPVLVALFLGLGFWWGLPLAVGAPAGRPDRAELGAPTRGGHDRRAGIGHIGRLPSRFWLFAAFSLLYGVVETMNGNWATLDMTGSVGASATIASIALTTFWAMVTVGRVLFAAIERSFPESRTYQVLPFVAAIALVGISQLPQGRPRRGSSRSAWPGSGAPRSCP